MNENYKVVEEIERPFIGCVWIDYLSLPDCELKLWLALKSFAWGNKDNCFPGISSLAKICNKNVRNTRKLLRRLEAKGLVRTEIHHTEGKANTYYLTNIKIEPEKLSTGRKEPRSETAEGSVSSDLGGRSETAEGSVTRDLRNIIRKHNNINIINNHNNDRNDDECDFLSEDTTQPESRFDEFWHIYPRKQNKQGALKIWKRKKLDKMANLILGDVENRIRNEAQWKNQQYIPHPTTYLNGERWNDQIIDKESNNGQQERDDDWRFRMCRDAIKRDIELDPAAADDIRFILEA